MRTLEKSKTRLEEKSSTLEAAAKQTARSLSSRSFSWRSCQIKQNLNFLQSQTGFLGKEKTFQHVLWVVNNTGPAPRGGAPVLVTNGAFQPPDRKKDKEE